jgi:Transposase DDE domain
MAQDNTSTQKRAWHESSHASLCLLGSYLQEQRFFRPLETRVQVRQKALKYTSVQKLEMLFVSVLAGAKAVAHTDFTLRADPALYRAFGLPGCAEQSVIADTLDAATEVDLVALRQAMTDLFERYSRARRHDFRQDLLVLDIDLSPLPASRHAEGSERGYMGRCRSKTGRKLVRVRAAHYQETVWEEIWPGNTIESLALLQRVLEQAEQRLGLAGESPDVQARRARTEIRLDSAWGSDRVITWLLERGYQVTGKFKSTQRVRKLAQGITTWQPTSSPGREVAAVPQPVPFARPLAQYAVRTPSKEKAGGYYYAVLFTSLVQRPMQTVVTDYDGRAGMEADLKSDKHGLALAVLRKRRLVAQTVVVLLVELAHNVLVWARDWLAKEAPRLRSYGIVRLVQEVWAVPGRIKLAEEQVQRVRLRQAHPLAREVARGWRPLLAGRPPGLVVS